MKRSTRIALLWVCLLSFAPHALAARGYQMRACGFDLNHNGIAGEPADCNVGDGITSDVDGNGIADLFLYVDCDSSGNDANPGTPGQPKHTIQNALNSLGAPIANQIRGVAFRGTCTGTITLSQSGAPGTSTRTPSGSEAVSFQYPRYPIMLVGWDTDNDGQYAPVDPDDTAVLDGNLSGTLDTGLNITGSRVEAAHFTARDYGSSCDGSGNFLDFPQGQGIQSHILLHDLALLEIGRGCGSSSFQMVVDVFNGGMLLQHFSLEQLQVLDFGSYFMRGAASASADGSGPWRLANLTLRYLGANNHEVAGIKVWGRLDGVEVLDSIFDANVANWTPQPIGGAPGASGITAAQCSRGWTIRNNLFRDLKQSINVQPSSGLQGDGACESRPMDQMVIDRNEIRNAYAPWHFGDYGIALGTNSGYDQQTTFQDATVTNNTLSSMTGWESCVWIQGPGHAGTGAGCPDGDVPGTIHIAGNTCVGDLNRSGWAGILLGDPQYGLPNCRQQDVQVRNNLITGLSDGDVAIHTLYTPSRWINEANSTLTGDLNTSGTVDAPDLQLVVNVLLQIETDPPMLARADLDLDTEVTAVDLQRLVNLLLGL